MGVNGLTKFIKDNLSDIIIDLNIIDEIRKYKKGNADKNPLILIDFSPLTRIRSEHYLDTLAGLRWDYLISNIKKLMTSMCEEGAEVVFFIEAPNKDKEKSWWFQRKTKECKHYRIVVAAMKHQRKLPDFMEDCHRTPPPILSSFMKQELKQFGKWIQCYDADVDLAIARYAKENDAFAIFSDDSDFMIYEGRFRKWNIIGIDYDAMTTKEMSREKLRKALNLQPFQMPLFSTLCGNDVVDKFANLPQFHQTCPNTKNKFVWIADVVREYLPDPNYNEEPFIETISLLINCTAQKISASFQQYNISRRHSIPAEQEPLLKKLLDHDEPTMYIALKGFPKRISSIYEIDEEPLFKKSQMEVCTWLYRCTLGILLKHKCHDRKTFSCPIFTVYDKRYQERKTYPNFPKITVPPLDDLILRNQNDALDPIRYDLLKWALHYPGLNIEEIMQVKPIEFIPIVLTLWCLVKHAEIPIKVADMILLSYYDVVRQKVPLTIPRPDHLDFCNFQATWLYIQTQAAMMELLTTLGLDHLTRYTAFDGVYFHHISSLYETKNSKQKRPKLRPIRKMRFYAALKEEEEEL